MSIFLYKTVATLIVYLKIGFHFKTLFTVNTLIIYITFKATFNVYQYVYGLLKLKF